MTRNPGATGTFALLGVVDVLLFSLAGNGGTGSIVFFAGTAGVVGGLVGRAMWRLIVESSDRWTLPIRGALAGGFTGWLSIPPTAMVWVATEQFSSVNDVFELFTSLNAVLEFGMGFVLFGIVGTIFVGWATIPTGALTGYVMGREEKRTDSDDTPRE
jgi:hypothetical protein